MTPPSGGKATELIEITDISDEDASYIASWLAAAYSKGETMGELLTGVPYEENVKLHEALFKGYLIRNSLCGTIIARRDLNAVVTRLRPGEEARGLDLDHRSGRDEDFDAFIKGSGGRQAIENRWEKAANVSRASAERYGAGRGVQHYHIALLGVKKDLQRQGVGRKLFRHVADEARAHQALLWFRCGDNNTAFYGHLGATRNGDATLVTENMRGVYSAKAHYGRSMEWG